MTELVKKLVSEANLTEDMAKKAMEVVVDFVKDKLPEPIGGQVVHFLNNQDASNVSDKVNQVLGGFGIGKQ
jgi:nucleoid DNA-binding protein